MAIKKVEQPTIAITPTSTSQITSLRPWTREEDDELDQMTTWLRNERIATMREEMERLIRYRAGKKRETEMEYD